MNIDITPIIEAVLTLIIALIAGRFLPWLKVRLSAEQYAGVEAAYDIAVYAAEEVYRAGHGEDKLKYAQNYLESQGITVDIQRLKAAVNKMRDLKGESSVAE